MNFLILIKGDVIKAISLTVLFLIDSEFQNQNFFITIECTTNKAWCLKECIYVRIRFKKNHSKCKIQGKKHLKYINLTYIIG